MPSGFKFPLLDSTGTASSYSDLDSMFAQQAQWNNAGAYTWGLDSATPVAVNSNTEWKTIKGSTGLVSLGYLAVKNDGSLWAWGSNAYGKLGLNTTTGTQTSPIQVGGLDDWKTVTIGDRSSLAIKVDGTLWAWGHNGAGQLGLPTLGTSSPVQVGVLTDWKHVTTSVVNNDAYGTAHTLAIKTDGTLWGWGHNGQGQLGYTNFGGPFNRTSPVQIGTLDSWKNASAGPRYSLGVRTDGTLWAWGVNGYGQLGLNDTVIRSSPVQIGTDKTWRITAAGYKNSAAIKTNGTLWVWGDNAYGQVNTTTSSPIQLVNKVAGNWYHTLAVKSDGALWAWGSNSAGQLGLGDTIHRSSPVQISALTNWSKVAGGENHSLAIKTDGTLWAWGDNTNGELGYRETTTGVYSSMYGSELTSAYIRNDGTLWMWGHNNYGQLGLNDTNHRSVPVQIGSLTDWKTIGVGNFFTIATKTNGTLWAWGDNTYTQLGLSTNVHQSSPVQVGALTNWNRVGAPQAGGNSLAIKTDGTLWAWGYNGIYYTLGLSNTSQYSSPVQVGTLTNWADVTSSYQASLGVKTDGTLWCWGYNYRGSSLPLNDGVHRSSPTQVGTLTNWKKVYGGYYGSYLATKTDGTLWAWGYTGPYGVLGLSATSIDYKSPVQVGSLTNWASISMVGNGSQTFAIKTDGTLWAWGLNTSGQLGLGDLTNRSSPVQVGTLSGWSAVSQNYNYGCYAARTNTLWSSGGGLFGSKATSSPIQVATLGYVTLPRPSISSPVQVGSLTNWSEVATGSNISFGKKTDGTLWAWGHNAYRQLGVDTSAIKSVVLGAGNCVIDNNNSLYVWGHNQFGQLGIGSINRLTSPFEVYGKTWESASIGNTSLAVKTNGTLWAWGHNMFGQLGLGDTIHRSSPVQVGALTNWKSVCVSGDTSFAVKTDGTAWSWGSSSYGNRGVGADISASSPVQIGTATDWKDIYASSSNSFLVKTDNSIWVFGQGDDYRQGMGDTIHRSVPTQNPYMTNWASLSSGTVSFMIKTDGTLWGWGAFTLGQLGLGSANDVGVTPRQIGSLNNWKSVACSYYSTAAVKTDGTLWTWGYSANSQLGDPATSNRSSPVQVGSATNWSTVYAGSSTSSYAALKTNGTLWSWGNNNYTQLGTGSTLAASSIIAQIPYVWGDGYDGLKTDSPVQVGALTNWQNISAGVSHATATKTDGTLWAWGLNNNGQLGLGNITHRSSPVQIGALNDWQNISAGHYHTASIKTDGTVWAWGENATGAIGVGDVTHRSSPIQIGSLNTWVDVSCGRGHTIAEQTNNTIWSWGHNNVGQLGLTDVVHRSSPVQVGALTAWNLISTSAETTRAVQADGSLWAFGHSLNGVLGLSSSYWVSSPTKVINFNWAILPDGGKSSPVQIGAMTNWKQVSVGYNGQILSIKSDSTLWGWGHNKFSQVGLGDSLDRSSPVQVGSLSRWTYINANGSGSAGIQSSDNT